MNRITCFVVFSLLVCGYAWSDPVLAAVSPMGDEPSNKVAHKERTASIGRTASIERAWAQFISLPALTHAQVSFSVVDAQSGQPVFLFNEQQGLTPASTLKNLTAAAALDLLGEDFRYQTMLGYLGTIDLDGTLHGDLVLVGSGDPSLGSDRFTETDAAALLTKWTATIRAAGIKRIEGRILADDLCFGGYQAPGGWPWHDLGNYYGAGVSGVNWKENVFSVQVRPGGRTGAQAELRPLDPAYSYLNLVNEIRVGAPGTGDNVYGYSAPYSTSVVLRGTYAQGLEKAISLAIPDPGYQLASDLRHQLLRQGITHEGEIGTLFQLRKQGVAVDMFNEGLARLSVHESPTLKDMVYWFNQKSLNLYGEALIKTMQANRVLDSKEVAYPADVSREAGTALGEFWAAKTGLPAAAFRLYDGSGLSPENRITTWAQVQVLAACQGMPWFPSFLASLPTNNGMKMKSGTIGGVMGYAGYHQNSRGEKYVFSILVNNYAGTAAVMRTHIFRLLDVLK